VAKKLISENIYISSFQASRIYGHNFRDEKITYNKIGSLTPSLELIKLKKEGFSIHTSKINGKMTSRDIINVDFKYKLDSSESIIKKTKKKIIELKIKEKLEASEKLKKYLEHLELQNWEGLSQEELRDILYENGFIIKQVDYDTKAITETKYVFYKRSGSKSRTGRALFIRESLHDELENWSNMYLKIPKDKTVDLAGLLAYQSLVSSGIKYTVQIPVKNIFMISDVDSRFMHDAKVVRSNGKFLDSFEEPVEISNSLFDGQSILTPEYFPDGKSMLLLRNHFFKSAAMKGDIQKFLKKHCPPDIEYEKWKLKDMFKNTMYAKDVHMITTPNSLKALKYNHLLGADKTKKDMYKYWKDIVKKDGELFGVCKHEYASKRGENLQQMSYQMLNSMPISHDDVGILAKFEIEAINSLKNDDEFYIKYLENSSDVINANQAWVELYKINKEIVSTIEFKKYRRNKIKAYVNYVKGGKIRLDGDYCVMIGNPIEMLLHTIKQLPVKDGVIDIKYVGELEYNQMYTTLHEFDKEYTCFRNPHTAQSNVAVLVNKHSTVIEEYFDLSKNMVIVNCINIPLQDIFSSCDFDSDCIAIFDNETLLNGAKDCFEKYKVVVNKVSADPNEYKYTNFDKARLDNILAQSQRNIGEVVNLGQLCMSKYYDSGKTSEELLKKIEVMTVLSCICIDLAKKFYDIDIAKEILHVRNHKEVMVGGKIVKPLFWSYVSDLVKKEKLVKHDTAMDYLVEILNDIDPAESRDTVNMMTFIKEQVNKGTTDRKQIAKIQTMIDKFLIVVNALQCNKHMDKEAKMDAIKIETIHFNKAIEKLKIRENTMIELVSKLIKSEQVDIGRIFKALLTQLNFKNVWICGESVL